MDIQGQQGYASRTSSAGHDDYFPDVPPGAERYRHRVSYLFNGQPRSHEIEHSQAEIAPEIAARRLMALHYGDSENSLLMPPAGTAAEQVMDQAQVMGISALQTQAVGRAR
ncbi:hypothetical protein [Pseudomonas typographi]|uniref:Uncharacterized protein n=1 Tax=Pseudomonas typographi TaxID=2715964 RepID=A0ABR7Z865_9PSED|nr:hypothetical protein [Pseudomonas typographi]MBD1553895.1 hypothetical protein [Pseudomonas typographi]MBD1589703.1 hypothetical protein [Pseudomonas typographi]MBD1601730.1 hypothetical protein [Pseudomonas typographi]